MRYNQPYKNQMQETSLRVQELINSILQGAGFDLRATVVESDLGCFVSMEGPDSGILLNQGAELLDALQQILNQALGRMLPKGQRIVCDANNYRAARESELRAMAKQRSERFDSAGAMHDALREVLGLEGEANGWRKGDMHT